MKNPGLIICALLMLSFYGRSICIGAEGASGGTNANSASVSVSDSARQLRIYSETLTRGSSAQSRTDAAIELLRRADDGAWEILLKAMLVKDNPGARRAVCQALIKSISWESSFRSRSPFIEPLVGMLVDESGADAKLAAESLMVFKYDEVSKRLSSLASASEIDRRIRLNAIYALSLWPDKGALLTLVNLLDDADVEVSSAAADALPGWIAVGGDKQKILLELQRKSPDEIIKAHLEDLRLEMGKVKVERDAWKKLYLGSIDQEYAKSGNEEKGKILLKSMASELGSVRVWAVGKVAAYTGSRPEGFRERLLALISDPERSIRLTTANTLANMSSLDPAAKLLDQLRVEKYTDVRLAIFDALGEACFFAFSPGSKIKLPESIRTETLQIATGYLSSPDGATAAKGAEVLGKLLELNGLPISDSQKYLLLLAKRYEDFKGMNGPLRGVLLNVMARLCSLGGYQEKSAEHFGSYFIEGLAVKDDSSVREAAAAGLVSIDKVVAFRLFKENGFANDSSALVRRMVIRLAGELGKPEELLWLVERVKSNGESEVAWEAMRNILLRQKAAEVYAWGQKLAERPDKSDHASELLEMTEKKAEGEKNIPVLTSARKSLLSLNLQKGNYSRVILYCSKLLDSTKDASEVEKLQHILLGAYLMTDSNENVVQMFSSHLSRADIAAGNGFVNVIDNYLVNNNVPAAKKAAVVKLLAGIKLPPSHTQWAGQIKKWQEQVTPK